VTECGRAYPKAPPGSRRSSAGTADRLTHHGGKGRAITGAALGHIVSKLSSKPTCKPSPVTLFMTRPLRPAFASGRPFFPRARTRVDIGIWGVDIDVTGLPTVILQGDLGRAAQGSRAQAPPSRCRSAPSRGRRRFQPPRSPERHERWRCRGSTGPSRNRERAIP
jgi:hypothetical protein